MVQIEEEAALVVRVPVRLIPQIEHLSERTSIPRRTIAHLLIEQGLREPMDWMRPLLAELEPVPA